MEKLFLLLVLAATVKRALAVLNQKRVLSELARQARGFQLCGIEACLPFLNSTPSVGDDLWSSAEDLMDVETLAREMAIKYRPKGMSNQETIKYLQLIAGYIGKYFLCIKNSISV